MSTSQPSPDSADTPTSEPMVAVAGEPVRYTGGLQPDPTHYDGRLPHAVGVHHVQVLRASRSRVDGGTGFTYNHQPFLVWWRDRFFLQYLSAPRHEHEAPTLTFLTSSADGYSWTPPEILFPEYRLPAFTLGEKQYAAGMSAVMHQRMGFYVAPNGRLLALGFYGICPDTGHSPNAGNGVGRVVREIHGDRTLGEIFFIRINRHNGFDERNTMYSFYTASVDAQFRAACEALLADKLATLQWWEEDRADDGFFSINPGAVPDAPRFDARMVTSAGAGKAFTWYTRPDGMVVGLWKNGYSALSADGGMTWTPIVRNQTLRTTGAKVWGQRTSDSRYVIVYNHSATLVNRFPISALVGEDGHDFPALLCLGGELPARRYFGSHKDAGMQYFRGISEGSAQPPDGSLWIAYSVNKEDIWVLRARVPLTGIESNPVRAGEFARAASIAELTRWNFHLPRWAGARIVDEPATRQRVLELRDEDPIDYVQAERVFPLARALRLRLRVHGRELPADGTFEIELQSQRHHRPVRLRFAADALLCANGSEHTAGTAISLGRWHALEIECDCESGRYDVRLDDTAVLRGLHFAEKTDTLERIVFRTGPWRGAVPPELVDGRATKEKQKERTEDLPGTEARVAPTIFWVGDVAVETV